MQQCFIYSLIVCDLNHFGSAYPGKTDSLLLIVVVRTWKASICLATHIGFQAKQEKAPLKESCYLMRSLQEAIKNVLVLCFVLCL